MLASMLIMRVAPLAAQEVTVSDLSPFSLAEAIERAQAVSPQRQAAQARTRAAEGALHQASRLPNPSIDLREENLDPSGNRRAPIDQTVDVFALLSQQIEIGGKRAARTAAAAAEVTAARAGVRQTERDLTLNVMRLYLAALQARTLTELLATHRDELQALVTIMTRRVQEGYAPEADLMKFRTEVARLDTQIARARLDLHQSLTALTALLELPRPLESARLVMPPPLAPPGGDPLELARQAVEHRSEVVAARARVERARHTLDLEKARRLPDPFFTAGYKRTNGQDTLVTGVMVPLPVFDRNAGNIERATAEVQAAALELDALVKQQTAATTALIRSAQELASRAQLVDQQLLQPAEVVRNAARASFREGAANILQLVDAERVYTETRRDALALKLEAYEKAFEA
ncbi:MAG TPA: TolC family protein, partial [Methylomirabilota bacterium]|nr:TolC family protein [Methylomirabilota bacterium]